MVESSSDKILAFIVWTIGTRGKGNERVLDIDLKVTSPNVIKREKMIKKKKDEWAKMLQLSIVESLSWDCLETKKETLINISFSIVHITSTFLFIEYYFL